MKKIFKLFGVLFSVALMGLAVSSCFPENIDGPEEVGLGIKTIFPTKVVPGLEITVNGSGFNDITEIVFPEEKTVTNFEKVTDNMLRVVVPAGVSAGKLIVKTENDQAESPVELTVGNTVVKSVSAEEGGEIKGGEQLTIYGTDLEFISSVEFFGPDGASVKLIKDTEFYRKGTSTVVITLPKKMTEEETVITGKITTIDGKVFDIYTLHFKPAADEGHWETVKTIIWENDGTGGPISWSSQYRFCLEGHDENSECIAEFPEEVWNLLMTESFFIEGTTNGGYNVRLTNGWWDASWNVGDITGGDRVIFDDETTFHIEINISDDPDFVATLLQKHLLFTGDAWTLQKIYTAEEVWIEGEGHMEIVRDYFWQNDGTGGPISWSSKYRFCLEGHDENNECIAEFDEELWNRLMTESFFIEGTTNGGYNVRLTNGWWDASWNVGDITGGDRVIFDDETTFHIEINISDDPDFVATLLQKHLLFTGDAWTLQGLYFEKEEWVSGGGGPKETVIWENDGTGGPISWSSKYRFCLEGHDENSECIAEFPEEIWNRLMTESFFIGGTTSGGYNVRLTNGWWDTSWNVGDITGGDRVIFDDETTFHIEINISDDADFIATLLQKHLLFTGDAWTLQKIYFIE